MHQPNKQHSSSSASADSVLPAAWSVSDTMFELPNPLSFSMFSESSGVTILANRHLPMGYLQDSARQNHQNSDLSYLRGNQGLYPPMNSNNGQQQQQQQHVYYFEVELPTVGSSPADVVIGFVVDPDSSAPKMGSLPGDSSLSVSWGSGGLKVNGKQVCPESSSTHPKLNAGDVIGCGIEVSGMRRVFFTVNGSIIEQPSPATSMGINDDSRCYPAVGFRYGEGDSLKGNFGLDAAARFRWPGSDRLSIVPCQPAQGSGFMNSDVASSAAGPMSRGSPFYGKSVSDQFGRHANDADITMNLSASRSATRPGSSPMVSSSPPSASASSPSPVAGGSKDPPLFGTKMSKKSSLEDDDPSNTSAHAHFDLGTRSSMTQSAALVGGNWQAAASLRSNNDSQSSWQYHLQQGAGSSSQNASSTASASSPPAPGGQSPTSPQSTARRRPSDSNPHDPRVGAQKVYDPSKYRRVVRKDEEEAQKKAPPIEDEKPAAPDPGSGSSRPGAVAVAAGTSGGISAVAKENYKTLLMACGKKRIDSLYVKDLVELCISDADKLERELEAKLTDESASDKVVTLLELISEINDAIDTGKRSLKRAKESSKSKPQSEGPTIELLVQNQDVFSLTCMLRAQNEKRLAAALALMKFARESDSLRDEIRSLGGMHSFLTLFRTNGMTREIQIVAAMSIAYLLPSFVASSQTSSSLGMKILECLRFLLASRAVTPQGTHISRDEMCQACSMGLNILWIHAIQPLMATEISKKSRQTSRPSLKMSTSRSMRMRARGGGGVFDQGQESIEIQELVELSVTMITHIAKLTEGSGLRIDMGYNIVEQVCEVDAARPIAVREGLLRILVDWIRSKDIARVRPAASALRYLISIDDKYMAGWIHSQVVNEGAVGEIVKLLETPVGHDVRVAVAQMLSALCVAPHTRAAVVEASCVSYLVAMLYEHIDPASEQMVQYAGTALLQLAAGAMTRAGGLTGGSLAILEPGGADKQDAVVK